MALDNLENKRNTVILLGIMVVLIVGAALLYRGLSERVQPAEPIASAQEEDQEAERFAAPDFTVMDADGNPVRLSDFLGTPVVVNFWASWCPPCKAEMPHFDAASAELDQVAFLMIDLVDGAQEKVETGRAYIEEQGYTFPVYYDTEQDAAITYGIVSIPTTLFIDREGYLITGARGMISEEALWNGLEQIVEEGELPR